MTARAKKDSGQAGMTKIKFAPYKTPCGGFWGRKSECKV